MLACCLSIDCEASDLFITMSPPAQDLIYSKVPTYPAFFKENLFAFIPIRLSLSPNHFCFQCDR